MSMGGSQGDASGGSGGKTSNPLMSILAGPFAPMMQMMQGDKGGATPPTLTNLSPGADQSAAGAGQPGSADELVAFLKNFKLG